MSPGSEPTSGARRGSRWTGIERFSEPVERDYRHDLYERSRRPVRWALLLGLMLYALFSVLDAWIVPHVMREVWVIRFVLVCPLLLTVLLVSYSPTFEKVMQPLVVTSVSVAGLGVVAMTALATREGASIYYAGLLLIVPYVHGLVRLPFFTATTVSLALSLAYEVVAIAWHRLPVPLLLNNTFFLLGANLMGMLLSYQIEAAFRRDFSQRRLLESRGREIEESMRRLREAQEHLTELEGSAHRAVDDLPAWAARLAADLRGLLEAREVRVWRLLRGRLEPVTPGTTEPPAAGSLYRGADLRADSLGRVVMPVAGFDGSPRGAVVVSAPQRWSDDERRIVVGFARHLGSALELLGLRQQVRALESHRENTRRRLRERGVALLRQCPDCGLCYDDRRERCEVDDALLIERQLPYRIDDRYRLTRLLGEGGMSQVFAAHDERLGRSVAVKVLRADLDAAWRTQLAHEARLVASIAHRGIVEVFDLGELDDGVTYVVMELLSGEHLGATMARDGAGAPWQVATLVREAGAAIGAAHRAGVLHRDLKPQNVFLETGADGGFRVRLLDFGVARRLALDATMTRPGMLLGTPAYMAPEQVRADPMDERADIYSFAAVAYEALTGRRIVPPGLTLEATMFAVLTATTPPVSTLVAGVPGVVDAQFAKALAKDPHERPSEVESWAAGLAEAIARIPPGASRWNVRVRERSAPRRPTA